MSLGHILRGGFNGWLDPSVIVNINTDYCFFSDY